MVCHFLFLFDLYCAVVDLVALTLLFPLHLYSPTEYQPKDNLEKVQTPAPVEPTTLYSQMGNGRVVNSQRRAQGAGTGSARPLSVKKMSSEKQGYDSSTATRE